MRLATLTTAISSVAVLSVHSWAFTSYSTTTFLTPFKQSTFRMSTDPNNERTQSTSSPVSSSADEKNKAAIDADEKIEPIEVVKKVVSDDLVSFYK